MEPTDKQLLVLLLRSMGLNLSEIASILGTSRQNVHSIMKRGLRNIKKFENMYKLMKACASRVQLEFEADDMLSNVAFKIMETADNIGIKLRGNEQDIVSYLKFEVENNGRELLEPCIVAITDEGRLVILTKDSMKEFSKIKDKASKLISIYKKSK